jgi:hypothetical protein
MDTSGHMAICSSCAFAEEGELAPSTVLTQSTHKENSRTRKGAPRRCHTKDPREGRRQHDVMVVGDTRCDFDGRVARGYVAARRGRHGNPLRARPREVSVEVCLGRVETRNTETPKRFFFTKTLLDYVSYLLASYIKERVV